MVLHITDPYLWLPVNKKNPEVKLHFYCEDVKFQEIDIQLGDTDYDFYTSMDVSGYLGQVIEIQGDVPEDMIAKLHCRKENVANDYPFRPQLHFTPEIGWHNDPNGLVYAEGVYHLYYQWNPYGVGWGNMHWGHAVSKDLFEWERKSIALSPDEYGTVFSGCGFRDKENVTGFGKNTLLFFYTAAGGMNQWSVDAGNRHTQRLAVSTDGGETLQRTEGAILEHIVEENRDPKIFYHKESAAYVMVLFLDGYEFAIFRSVDLLHWEETQRLIVEGMRECPDLMKLKVKNVPDEEKWVFWSADGYYVIGSFDGYHFTAESEVRFAYSTKLPYAAQTYAGVDDRTISVSWFKMENNRGNYRGLMSIPTELSLIKKDLDYVICFQLPREFEKYRRLCAELEDGKRYFETRLSGAPVEFVLEWAPSKIGVTRISIGDTLIVVCFEKGVIEVQNEQIYSEKITVPFDKEDVLSLDLVLDQEVIEFFGNDGMIYGAVETEENVLGTTILLESDVEMDSVKMYDLVKDGK